jgi:hypothetical protein
MTFQSFDPDFVKYEYVRLAKPDEIARGSIGSLLFEEPIRFTASELMERVIDALLPSRSRPVDAINWHVPPGWSEVWADVRSEYGRIRSVLFITLVIVSFPLFLLWTALLLIAGKLIVRVVPVTSSGQLLSIMKALLLTVVFGSLALWIWSWPGLLVVCLFVWLFTLLHQTFSRKNESSNG